MAIDFTNRNPDDPKAVHRIERAAKKGWVKTDSTGKWEGPFTPTKPASTAGWTEVDHATVILNDGTTYTVIVREDGTPISEIGDSGPADEAQTKAWKDKQNQTAPPGGLPTRTVNGQVFQWNPATRAYDIPTGQAPTGTAQTAAPGGKPFIDDGPEARENGRRWGWNDQTRLYDRDLGPSPTAQEIIRNRSLPPDQDPKAETDAERAQRAKETIARQDREADRNKPGAPTLKPDGKGGTIAVQVMPDGSIKTTPLPGVPSDKPAPERVTVNGTVYERDPQSGQYRPAAGLPQQPNPPASADDFTPDITKPQMGLAEYRQKLAQLRASGAITEEQYNTRAQRAYETAVAEAKRIDTMVSAQQAAAQDLITQRGQDQQASVSRLGQANQATATALSESRQFAGQMTPAGVQAAGGPILPAIMALQDARGQAWGGFHNPATVTTGQFPAWNQMAGMGFGGAPQTGGAVPPAAAPTPPAAQAPGGMPAPLLPPRPPVPAGGVAPPAAAPGVQAPAMAAPAVNPSSNVAQPGDPRTQPPAINPVTGEPTGLTPLPVNGQFPINPPAGQPGHNPNTPVGMAPQTLPGIARMDPLLASILGEDNDPDWTMAVMTAARNRGLA